MRRARLLAALAVLLAACSKTKNVHTPKKLVPFAASLRVQRVWTASVGGTGKPLFFGLGFAAGGKSLLLGLGLATGGGRVYAAGYGGKIAAFDLESGRRLWLRRVKAQLGGGPGADSNLIVVGSVDGDVFALDAVSGAVRWHVNIAAEILAAPAVSPKIIVVRGVDGSLHGLSPVDGHELWRSQVQVPALSLRGTSSPVIVGRAVVCGYDNGTVVDTSLSDGSSVWTQQISTPHGSNAIEELNDVDATPRLSRGEVYVAQYQGRVAMLTLKSGQISWSRKMSSYRGMSIDAHDVYVSTSEGEVAALRRSNGTVVWQQDALAYRELTTPVVSGNAIVVVDYQGYVHWLAKSTGAFLARARSGRERVSNAPVVAGGLVLVINDEGAISAFRTTPLASPQPAKPRRGKRGH